MRGMVLRSAWPATVIATALAVVVSGAPPAEGPVLDRAALVIGPAAGVTSLDDVARAPAGPPAQSHRPARPAPEPHLMVHVDRPLAAHLRPDAGSKVIGTVVTSSKYYRIGIVAWVEEAAKGGRWGRLEIPYSWPRRDGWIRLDGLRTETTWVSVEVDLSRHRVTVSKRGGRLFSFAGAIGTSASPTPPGEYFVTDRIAFARGSYLGSFAFGISGIQPRLPAGWSGGNQLAIHGTNSPWTIGRNASAGCVRVSEQALARMKPLLRLGTPVVIVR